MSARAALTLPERDTLARLRTRYLRFMGWVGVVSAIIGLPLLLLAGRGLAEETAIVMVLVLNLILLDLLRRGRLALASNLLVAMLMLITVLAADLYPLMGTLALVSAAILTGLPVFLFTLVIVLGTGLARLLPLAADLRGEIPAPLLESGLILLALLVISGATRYVIVQARQAAAATRASTTLLEAVAEIGQQLATLLNLGGMLVRAVELIRERFAFYHVQIYLVNETGDQAQLTASTAMTGGQFTSRQRQVAVGSPSAVGRATLVGEPAVASRLGSEADLGDLLPDTQSQLAVPISDGDRIIGALDVQSRRTDAFDADRILALQVMANLLGTSIRNARLFEAQASSADETRRLFVEAENNLSEIRRLNQQLTQSGWQDYLRSRPSITGVTFDNESLAPDESWSGPMLRATQSRQAVSDELNGGHVIAVPVTLGDEVIGAIEVQAEGDSQEIETVEMMKAVAQRLAISLDKARLFEESQQATAQEQRINEIVGRFQTVNTVDDLLRITVSELSQTFGARRAAIRLGSTPQAAANGEEQTA